MPNHTKPTKEELAAAAKKSLEDLAALDATPEPTPSEPIPDPEPSEPIPSEPEPTPSEPIPSDEPDDEPEPEPDDNDYKKKFAASSREAQKIAAKNRKINQAISDAGEIPEPTEEEMQAEYDDWDVMTDNEQKLAKDNLVNKRRFELIHKGVEESKKIEKWGEDVEEYISDPKTLVDNPELEGKQEEFKLFANDPEYHGTSFKLLVSAFLHDQASKPKPKNKGKMFEVGSGGANDKPKPKSDILSVEEGRRLMHTNYEEWKRKLRAGKIANE